MVSNSNVLPSSIAAVVASIDPDAYTANTYLSGWVDMSEYRSIMAIVSAGTLGTDATVDAKLRQAKTAAGGSAEDITGKAITQLTQAGTDSDKQAIINLRDYELDVNEGFTHVALSITVATATSDVGGLILGFNARYQPPAHAATVDEVIE